MSCSNLTMNLVQNCDNFLGGLNRIIYAANLADIQEISSSTNTKTMDTITMNINPLTTAPYFWYQISFKKGTAGFNNEGVFGNSVNFNQTLTFNAEDITEDSLEFVESIANTELVFIVKDNQDKYTVLGRKRGLKMSALTKGSGVADGDMYGSTITFSGVEREVSNLVLAGTIIDVYNGTTAVPVTL